MVLQSGWCVGSLCGIAEQLLNPCKGVFQSYLLLSSSFQLLLWLIVITMFDFNEVHISTWRVYKPACRFDGQSAFWLAV